MTLPHSCLPYVDSLEEPMKSYVLHLISSESPLSAFTPPLPLPPPPLRALDLSRYAGGEDKTKSPRSRADQACVRMEYARWQEMGLRALAERGDEAAVSYAMGIEVLVGELRERVKEGKRKGEEVNEERRRKQLEVGAELGEGRERWEALAFKTAVLRGELAREGLARATRGLGGR